MKSLGALANDYQSAASTFCTIWYLLRRDNQAYTFTDLDRNVVFGGLTYAASGAYTPSELQSKVDLSVDNMETEGLLDSAGITLADVEAGLWDGAYFEVSEVNYRNIGNGRNFLKNGWLGQVRRGKSGMYVAELRGLTSKLQQNVGRVVLPTCDAVLGDARCGVDLGPFTMTGVPVDSVASRISFTAGTLEDSPPSNPPDWHTFGVITFETGLNAGISREVKEQQSGGIIFLQDPFPFEVVAGDEFTAIAGCNKLLKLSDGTYNGHCKVKFDNVIRFRGYAEVPLMNEAVRGGR